MDQRQHRIAIIFPLIKFRDGMSSILINIDDIPFHHDFYPRLPDTSQRIHTRPLRHFQRGFQRLYSAPAPHALYTGTKNAG